MMNMQIGLEWTCRFASDCFSCSFARFFHSTDSKANRFKNKESLLHNGSSGSDPLIHRKNKLGSFVPHISVSDYSASSRRPSALEDNLENEAMLNSSRFNSNNLLSSDASNTSTSRTSLHEQLSSSNSSSAGLASMTPSNRLSNSSTFDEAHLRPAANEIARRASSENSNNKLNPNALLYRQSRSLSNSAHSQEIEDQLLEKSFYSQPTLLAKNTVRPNEILAIIVMSFGCHRLIFRLHLRLTCPSPHRSPWTGSIRF